jgi:hypothetical protein
MWTTAAAVDAFKNALRAADTELDVLRVQNTVYGLFIVLEALLCGEGEYRGDGEDKYVVDEVSYDLTAGIPAALIGAYGLIEGGDAEVMCEDILKNGAALIRGFAVVPWADELTRMEDDFGVACAERPEWNYYGAVGEDGVLSDNWQGRARSLLTAVRDVGVGVAADVEAQMLLSPNMLRRNRTRRIHGRRALTPVRSRRGAAITRRRL